MKKIILTILLCIPILGFGQYADYWEVSLTLPEIALMDIEPNNSTIKLEVEPPSNPGEEMETNNAGDNSKWINYTCTTSPISSSKRITVEIIQGSVPAGMEVRLEASSFQGNSGIGNLGMSMGEIVLSHTPNTIISNIGGSHTGNKKNNGHNLNFSLHIVNYDLIEPTNYNSSTALISYTLMDN